MDKVIELGKDKYHLIKNYKDAFSIDEMKEKYTDFFADYDFIVGDYAYNKLRLKGFCNKKNKKYKEINDKECMEEYIQKDCAYECKYFILERIEE